MSAHATSDHLGEELAMRLECGDVLGAAEICESVLVAINLSLGRAMIQLSRVRYMELLAKEKELHRVKAQLAGRDAA